MEFFYTYNNNKILKYNKLTNRWFYRLNKTRKKSILFNIENVFKRT